MVAFVHVGTLSDVLADIRDWLDAGSELLSDLVGELDDEADEGDEEADEDEGDEGGEDGLIDDDDDYNAAYNAGYDDAATAILGAVGDYVLDNPGATVEDVITFLKGEFQ